MNPILATVVLTLSAAWLTLVSALLIPFLTGLITKLGATSTLKGAVTIVLAALAGVLQTVVSDGGVVSTETLLNAGVTLGVSTLLFFNLYGPANIDSKMLPNFGLGGNGGGVDTGDDTPAQ